MQLQLSSSPRQFLRLLLWLRLGAIVGQSLTLGIVSRVLHVALPLSPMIASIAALAGLAALSALRLRIDWPATQLEIAGQLLADIAQLTVLLYLSGGTTNPFASLYLIPIALAAVGLGWRYIGAIALVCVCAYGWLIVHFMPLDYPQLGMAGGAAMQAQGHSQMAMNDMHSGGASPSGAAPAVPMSRAFDMHMAGMQVTFLLSCALLASALSFMAVEIRRRDRQTAALREQSLRREHLSAMGLLAAGAAHELSTPLLSMSLLVEELQAGAALDAQSRADLGLLGRQIQLCKDKLSALLQVARHPREPTAQTESLQSLLHETIEQWRLMRPAVCLVTQMQGDVGGGQPAAGAALLRVDQGFSQALTSLLDNAADASAAAGSDRVLLSVSCDEQCVRIAIDDEGQGMGAHLERQIGRAVFTTKADGFGLGLVLSHANLDRQHGEVSLSARPGGGTRTLITLPREDAARPVASRGLLYD